MLQVWLSFLELKPINLNGDLTVNIEYVQRTIHGGKRHKVTFGITSTSLLYISYFWESIFNLSF